MTQPPPKAALLIDDVLPEFDATIVEHLVVDAQPEAVYAAVRSMDFLEISSPLMDAAMFVRALPDRIGRRMRGDEPSPAPPSATLADMFDGSSESEVFQDWVGLGEDPPREIVFGAAGKVWQPEIEWKPLSTAEFATFDEPGFAKIAAGFSLREYGENRTLLTYEARTSNTDDDSRRRFRRYWWIVHVFVGVVMRAALRTAKELSERTAGAPRQPAGSTG